MVLNNEDLCNAVLRCFRDCRRPRVPMCRSARQVHAGGYIPARYGLQVDMNGDFASVHCLVPGFYEFRSPDGKVVPMDLRVGETRWLFFGPFLMEGRGKD